MADYCWNMKRDKPIQNIQINLENANFYAIKNNILDIQDQQ